MISKDQSREDSKNEYILQLTQTNKDQHEHYYTILPDVFNVSQKSDKVSWQSQTSSPRFTLFPTMITIVNPAIETPDLAPDWTTTLQLLEYVPYSLCYTVPDVFNASQKSDKVSWPSQPRPHGLLYFQPCSQ